MSAFIEVGVYCVVLVIMTPLLGKFLATVCSGEMPSIFAPFKRIETLTYKISGIDPTAEMNWRQYAKALLIFNFIGLIAVLLLQLCQHFLRLNPQGLPAVAWHTALNTAISFATNTNWQSYAGETTMSYLTQMLGLTVQNFLSAATGMGALLVMVRGLTRATTTLLGNFWVDLVRTTIYILLPLSLVLAVFLMQQGVVQSFDAYVNATTLEGAKQMIPLGPAASQIAIKQLGTNGGGFFNANSAHPFENPTPLSNFWQMLAILLIPAATTAMYGLMIKSRRHGWALFGIMFFLWSVGLGVCLRSEASLMEGKEQRFGVVSSLIWATATTAASNGSVNAMHSSLSPISGGVALFNIMLGEIVFGGIGVGLCGMLLFVLMTVFLAGLLVGRTPEYLGKKIDAAEMKWVILAILTPCVLILVGSALALSLPVGTVSLLHRGPHGLSEVIYAFASAAGNNGSAFAGLNANTPFYNMVLGISMLIGRLAIIVPCLAIGGSLAQKKSIPASSGTFQTAGLLFPVLLLAVILIVGVLTFLPALMLGPIVEQLLALQGRVF